MTFLKEVSWVKKQKQSDDFQVRDHRVLVVKLNVIVPEMLVMICHCAGKLCDQNMVINVGQQ